jgi:hypothetical protein
LTLPGLQVVPEQQPFGQLCPSHTHCPPEQRWPFMQALPVPHLQLPLVQVSALPSHTVHAPPFLPQLAADGTRHWPAEQQPLGQLVESHTQAPPMQRCPLAQAGELPHLQEPPVHASASVELHGEHAEPPAPHAPSDGAMQAVPKQQPVGQLLGLHAHAPLTQVWPPAHGGPEPHWQLPATQASALAGSHAAQLAPPDPHVPSAGELQVAPEQQPPAQLTELHPEQAPPAQLCGDGHAWHC